MQEALSVLDDDVSAVPTPSSASAAPARSTLIWRGIWRWSLILAPVVIVVIAGWRQRWVTEDAFIDFRVVHNVLSGHGPVFNVGERVEVYSDPLWVAILTLVSGALGFLRLEWWSVILGIAFTALGVGAGAAAVQRIARRHSRSIALPVGMLLVAVVPAVWDFTTSGLETGLMFGWLGGSFWLVARVRDRGRGSLLAAFIVGLGVTVRPDLFLFTICFGAVLLAFVHVRADDRAPARLRSYLAVVAALLAAPLLSELFRIGYFGLLVSNTAIGKSAFSFWPAEGWHYLSVFNGDFWLWIPILVLGLTTLHRTASWFSQGHRLDAMLLIAPLVGGLLDAAYVVAIGGDFMHSRFLLPGLMGVSLAFFIDPERRLELMGPLVIVLIWAGFSATTFRDKGTIVDAQGTINERAVYVAFTQNPNPVTTDDYAGTLWGRWGGLLRAISERQPHDAQLLIPRPILLRSMRASSPLPQTIFVPDGHIGVLGNAVGEKVYIFDRLSLSNPVASHFVVVKRGRPGHEKHAPEVWMIARFGAPGTKNRLVGAGPISVFEARRALSCQPLAGYLKAIVAPLTPGGVLANVEHAFTWTTMSFSSRPWLAAHELCGPDG